MGHCPHFDRRQHWFAKLAPEEEGLERADRLVVAHILIHRQLYPSTVTEADNLLSITQCDCQRLLAQDALDVIGMRHRFFHDP